MAGSSWYVKSFCCPWKDRDRLAISAPLDTFFKSIASGSILNSISSNRLPLLASIKLPNSLLLDRQTIHNQAEVQNCCTLQQQDSLKIHQRHNQLQLYKFLPERSCWFFQFWILQNYIYTIHNRSHRTFWVLLNSDHLIWSATAKLQCWAT
jgi:hypothetical protein